MQLKTQHQKSSHATTTTLARVKNKKRAHPRRPAHHHHQNGNNLHASPFYTPSASPKPRTFMSSPNNPPLPGGDAVKEFTQKALDAYRFDQYASTFGNLLHGILHVWIFCKPFFKHWTVPVYTPQTLAEAPLHLTAEIPTLTLIRRGAPFSSSSSPSSPNKLAEDAAYKSLHRMMSAYPDVFNFVVVDVDDELNAQWRGRYPDDTVLPVVLVAGEPFSEKFYTKDDDKRLEAVFRKAKGFDV